LPRRSEKKKKKRQEEQEQEEKVRQVQEAFHGQSACSLFAVMTFKTLSRYAQHTARRQEVALTPFGDLRYLIPPFYTSPQVYDSRVFIFE